MIGNANLKLKKNDAAIAAYNKAATLSPNPAVAYFNLCATMYNMGQPAAKTAAACDKAIAADPKKADAYFVKGSALFGEGAVDKSNKFVVPPGAVEALKQYLALAPDGPHVQDVKAMLDGSEVTGRWPASPWRQLRRRKSTMLRRAAAPATRRISPLSRRQLG